MRKLLLILLVSFSLLACSKEDCNCGRILSDRASDYSIVIRNSCSGNEKRFYLNQGDWMNAHPGSDYCITDTTEW